MRTRNNSLAVLLKKNYVINMKESVIRQKDQEVKMWRDRYELVMSGLHLANNVAVAAVNDLEKLAKAAV